CALQTGAKPFRNSQASAFPDTPSPAANSLRRSPGPCATSLKSSAWHGGLFIRCCRSCRSVESCPRSLTSGTNRTASMVAGFRRRSARSRAPRLTTSAQPSDARSARFATATEGPRPMIVDFQHHFTPRELMPKDLGRRKLVSYDEHGAPSFILHWMLFDLDEHIRMMDEAGIDVAFLTSAAGMCADLDKSRLCNETAKRAERDYPGRFIGAAHANPLGGAAALRELARCKHELGFPGVVITSETNGLYLDATEFEPFWTECAKLGLFVFVHPALKLNQTQQFDGYDMARSVGREFSLVMATIRL